MSDTNKAEMMLALRLISETAGGEAPDFILINGGDWATLGWELIPSWIRLKWRVRRRKPNGYVAVTMRQYRLQHGACAHRGAW